MLTREWFTDPNAKVLCVAHNDIPLMMEVLIFPPNAAREIVGFSPSDSVTIHVRYTVHFDRDRPLWFWAVCARPVFEALKELGMKKLITTAIERPDWVANLKATYGGETYRVIMDDKGRRECLEYDLGTAISKTPSFPQRKTKGSGWEWKNKEIRITEVDDSNLEQFIIGAKGILETGIDPNEIEKDIRAWWELDKASILQVFENDLLIDARLIRLRRSTSCLNWVLPRKPLDMDRRDINRRLMFGVSSWMKDVGYTECSVAVPKKLYDEGTMLKEKIGGLGATLIREIPERDMYEFSWEIDKQIDKYKDFLK